MSLSDAFLGEWAYEARSTRLHLERTPMDRGDWQPHPKSMKLGRLASHLAEIPIWATMTVRQGEMDVAPAGVAAARTQYRTVKELLEAFDTNMAEAKRAVSEMTDAQWLEPWSLKKEGKVVMTQPKVAVMRGMVLNHTVHHRAQLGVYLRLLDVPLPMTYGPSADESRM